MATQTDPVRVETADGATWLTFNRPERLNSFNADELAALVATLEQCEADASVRAVVITGSGRAFTSGLDLHEAPAGDPAAMARWMARVAPLWGAVASALVRMNKPVLAAVNGSTVGGGVGIALASDFVIASSQATFTPGWLAIGVSIDTGSSWSLPAYLGMRRATEWVYTNRTLTAAQALEWGLVNRVVDAAQFEDEVRRVGRELAAYPTHLFAMSKALFRRGRTHDAENQHQAEADTLEIAAAHPHFHQTLDRFYQKRGSGRSGLVRLDPAPDRRR